MMKRRTNVPIDLEDVAGPISPEELEFIGSWFNETYLFRRDLELGDLATARCAELAEGLEHHAQARDEDPDFVAKVVEWLAWIWDNDVAVLIEQATDEAGELLSLDKFALRLRSAPPEWIDRLSLLLTRPPEHVVVHLLRWVSVAVRIVRARRSGSPFWAPANEDPVLDPIDGEPVWMRL
jgi:hypothetical protein